MSTVEKLFVQIFDRKKWIVDQLNQQKDLYDQYLASTLLINGIRPPSWLLNNTGFQDAGSSDLKGLKKEDLISGLLFPPPRSNVPSSSIGYNTFYNRSISVANNGQPSDNFFSETCASNKYFDVEDRSTVVPKCHLTGANLEVGCTSSGVPELDQTITSPQQQLDSRMADTCFEPFQSLARIQRSKSRQKALELRNSATAKSKKRPRKDSCDTVYMGRVTRSKTSSEQPHHVKELLEQDKASNEVGSKALHSSSATQKICSADRPLHLLQMFNCIETDDGLRNALDTQVTAERSSSGQKDLEVNIENNPTKGDTTNEHSSITVRSQTTRPDINSAEGLVRPDNSSKVFIGRVTRSRSASMNKAQQANPFNQIKDSDTQVLLHKESSADRIAGTELVSDAPVDRHSICSSSKQEGSSMGADSKFLVSRPLSDDNAYVEPKQLIFDDDDEDSRLNETLLLSFPKEMQVHSPGMRPTSLKSIGSLKEVPISSDQLHADPVNLMESDSQVLVNEESSAAIAGFKLVSAAALDRRSICSSSEKEHAGMGANLEFSVSRPQSDVKTFVEPKEHIFDDVEDIRLNENVGISMGKERQDRSPEMENYPSSGSFMKLPISSDPEHTNPVNLIESDYQVLVNEENSAAAIAGFKLPSVAPGDYPSICSRSEEEGAGMGAHSEFSLSRPLLDGKTFVEPKELVFDNVEDCRLNENVGLSLEKERQDRSPGMRNDLESLGSLIDVPLPNVLHEICVASVNERLLEKDQEMEVVSKEEKQNYSLAPLEENFENVGRKQSSLASAGNCSKVCSLSSRRGPSEGYESAVSDISPEGKKNSMQESIESLKKVSMSSKIGKLCTSYPDECLLKMDHSKEVVDTEEELQDHSGSHSEERHEFVGMGKAESDLLLLVSSTRTSNVTAPPSREGLFQTSDVIVDSPPGSIAVSNKKPVESEKKVTISNDIYERRVSSFDVEPFERDGEEDCRMLPNASPDNERLESFEMEKIGFHINPSSSPYTGRTSHVSPLSTRKETPNGDEHVIPDTSSESDKIKKQVSATSYHQNGLKDSFGEKSTGEFDLAPTKILPEDFEVDLDACNGPEESLTQLKNPNMFLEAPETGSRYVVAANSGMSSVLWHVVTQGICQIYNGEHALRLSGPASHGENVDCPQSDESLSTEISIQAANATGSAWENSWPQHKRRKIEGQSVKGLATSPRLRRVIPHHHEDDSCRDLNSPEACLGADQEFQHFPMSCEMVDFQSSVIGIPVAEMSQTTKRLSIDSPQYSAKLQSIEGELGRQLVSEDANIQLGFEETLVESPLGSNGNKQEHSQSCSKDVVGLTNPTSVAFDEKMLCNSQDEQNFTCLESKQNLGCVGQMDSVEQDMQEKISNLGEQLFSHYDDLDLTDAIQAMPELEKFSYSPTEFMMSYIGGDTIGVDTLKLPSTTMERISALEELCRSSSMGTPSPDVSECKRMDQSTQPSCNSMGAGCSYSDCLPSSSCQSACAAWSPYTPPVGKLSHNIISLSAGQGSKKKQSTNPELTPIHEDSTSSSEENGNVSKVVDQFQEGTSAIKKNDSTCRGPLADITNINPKVCERGSIVDSANADLDFHGSQMGTKKKSRDGYGTDKRYKNKNKENQSTSLGGSCMGTIKSKLRSASNTMEKKASQTFVSKERKGANIVSNVNVKSFLQCVQPKHSSAAMPIGKTRDHPVKVKALEAAQAAKREEEKKKNDREMRKEAAKLERERREKEKARQKELNQKQKEEEAKKKEAIKAQSKRLREEEEKNKERKRMCIEEERRQQKEQKRKLHVEKEEKDVQYRNADEKESKRKGFQGEEIKHHNPSKVKDRDECTKRMETQPSTTKVSAGDTKKTSNVYEVCETFKESHEIEKVVGNSCKEKEDVISVTGGTQEQTYAISPYKSSDDEEEEEPTGKAFPSWSREKCVAPLLCALQQIDPHEVFPTSSFCSITEVIMSRKKPK